jgi:putative transferase (TIGR04331 family)
LQQNLGKSEKLFCKAKIELIGLYFSKTNLKKLTDSLGDQLYNHNIPDVTITKKLDIDYSSRNKFSKVFTGNDFLIFLGETLKFGIPKCFLEYFKIYECQIKELVNKSDAEYVISENWISNIPSSMYVALSKENGKKFICHEHSGPGGIIKPNIVWHEEKYSDVFITCGWTNGSSKLVKGGFASRDLQPRTEFLQIGSILFIDFTRPPYLIQYTGSHHSNFERIKQLESTESFLIQAKATLGNNLSYRDRPVADFWNTRDALSHILDGVKIDEGDLSESIKSARLVILNHLSSSAAEVILNDIPFIFLVDSEIDIFDERFDGIISKLKESLILHDSPESAIKHANQSNNKLQKWWESKSVRQTLAIYKKNLVGPPEQSIQYIINLQKKIRL